MSDTRILVLDDDHGIVNVATRVLNRAGFSCVGTTSVAHGLHLVLRDEFEVLLTDFHMPEMTGLDVASATRRAQPEMVVVIMTGQATLDLAVQALNVGAHAFVVKPFAPGDLVSRVTEAIERHRAYIDGVRLGLLAPVLEKTLGTLAAAIETRDPATGSHTNRLHALADALCRAAGLDEKSRAANRHGALLHDIGKIGVPDSILRKPGPLTSGEMLVMKQHAEIGATMIAGIDGLESAVPLVLHHHERWDGTGYPDQLAAEAIPLGARILAIADAYDAMISLRPYRAPSSVVEARAEIQRMSGSQFDPTLVALFLALSETQALDDNLPGPRRVERHAVAMPAAQTPSLVALGAPR